MLTDQDKIDLIRFGTNMHALSQSDRTRIQVAADATASSFKFLIDHPDACAAEVNDFLSLSMEDTEKEFRRLEHKGLL